MYDAVNPANLTAGWQAAGYIDGAVSAWPAWAWAAFPHAVTITTIGTPGARVADVETGDLSPSSGAQWARNELAHGRGAAHPLGPPVLYLNDGTYDETAAALAALGLRFDLAVVQCWLALWDNDPTFPDPARRPGVIAKQYAHDLAPGYDVSATAPGWPYPPTPEVSPMYDPPIAVVGRIVDSYATTGGARFLTDAGDWYELGSPCHLQNPSGMAGANWQAGGRVAARIDRPGELGYWGIPPSDTRAVVIDTAGERYICEAQT